MRSSSWGKTKSFRVQRRWNLHCKAAPPSDSSKASPNCCSACLAAILIESCHRKTATEGESKDAQIKPMTVYDLWIIDSLLVVKCMLKAPSTQCHDDLNILRCSATRLKHVQNSCGINKLCLHCFCSINLLYAIILIAFKTPRYYIFI